MSSASLKIAEALGTTFMVRQEQHLEKQRKKVINIRQCTCIFSRRRLKFREAILPVNLSGWSTLS